MGQLILQQIEKRFGKNQILNGLSLQLEPGIFGLLGPNGAGKTTLMRMIAAIIQPDRGEISYDGIKWSTQPERARGIIGYLPQDFDVLPHLNVFECLDYIAQIKGIHSKETRRKEIDRMLQQVNLLKHSNLKVKKLSGGMRRRLGIAQALIGDPKILIVDEPTTGLDPEERIRFRNLLREIAWNRIVILSTHIVEDVSSTCRSAAILHQGNLKVFNQLENLASLASGQVWNLSVSHPDFRQLSISGEIVSSNIYSDRVELRIWSEKQPSENATLTEPTIEEGYMTCIKN